MATTINSTDILQALYVLSPVGARGLTQYLEQKKGKVTTEVLYSLINSLLAIGTITTRTIDGITLWALPGTWG